jgi:hypothetical protein
MVGLGHLLIIVTMRDLQKPKPARQAKKGKK